MKETKTPKCTMMIGLPASGKSTFIKKLMTDNTWIYSTDMYIETVAEDHGLTYGEVFESNIQRAIQFSEQKLKSMIQLKKDIIWDQTNLGVGKRKKIINRMKAEGYEVHGICLLPPKWDDEHANKEWDFRLNNRPGKVIPAYVLSNMMESFTIPTKEEGFDSLTFFYTYNNERIQ